MRRYPSFEERTALPPEPVDGRFQPVHDAGQRGVVESEDLLVDAGAQPGYAGCARHGHPVVGGVSDGGDPAPGTLVGPPQCRGFEVEGAQPTAREEKTEHPRAEAPRAG